MMLTLEQQVCTLESAKRLKELGFKQESLFYYDSETGKLRYGFTSHTDDKGIMHWSISAYTCAELGEMLKPSELPYFDYHKKLWILMGGFSETEVEARALMLIHLAESGLMKGQYETRSHTD